MFADIDETSAQSAAEESSRYASNPNYTAHAIAVDVADEESVQTMVDATVKQFGRIDYCVNSAGVGSRVGAVPLAQMDSDDNGRSESKIHEKLLQCHWMNSSDFGGSTLKAPFFPCVPSVRP